MPGICESCASNAHSQCSEKDCRCFCKRPPAPKPNQQPTPVQASPYEAICPKCQAKFVGANFCRADGAKLIRGKQCLDCGAVMNQADQFCYMCGQESGKKRDRDAEQRRLDGVADEETQVQ